MAYFTNAHLDEWREFTRAAWSSSPPCALPIQKLSVRKENQLSGMARTHPRPPYSY